MPSDSTQGNRDKVSIEERVQLMYAQSGGPEKAAPKIEELMKKHLLYGKDHGPRGTIETYQNVIENLFREDRTLSPFYDIVKKAQFFINMFYQTNNLRVSSFIQATESRNRILDSKLTLLLKHLEETRKDSGTANLPLDEDKKPTGD